MVKKNEYPRKNNFSKDGAQTNEPAASNSQPKSFQKDGETSHKENHVRNNRPPRDNQQRDNVQQRDNQQRDAQKRENQSRENGSREPGSRENNQRDNQHNKENFQRNYHRENAQSRENREPYRQHFQRPAIKPRAEETVDDIVVDIGRIEKEIELELKEIRSMRLGV